VFTTSVSNQISNMGNFAAMAKMMPGMGKVSATQVWA
jgi:signal recognition particle GTPase